MSCGWRAGTCRRRWAGSMRLRLVNAGPHAVRRVRADVHDGRPARAGRPGRAGRAARRAAHVVAPPAGFDVGAGRDVGVRRARAGTGRGTPTTGRRAPTSRAADGSIRPVRTGATGASCASARRRGADLPAGRTPTARVGGRRGRGTAGCTPTPRRCCRRRASTSCTSTSTRRSGRTSTSCVGRRDLRLTAGSDAGLQRALTALVRAAGAPPRGDRPTRPRPRVARAAHRPGPAVLPGHRRRLADRRRRVARPQPVAPAPDRRRGLARAGRRLPGAHRGRRVARPRPADPAAARLGQRAVRRCLRARRDRRHGSRPPTRPASSSCRRSTCRATASPPSPPCPSSPTPTTRAAR